MADSLELAGKLDAMGGIEATIVYADLYSTTNVSIDKVSASGATHFNVIASTGQLKNTVAAIDFTVAAGDVDLIASYVLLLNVASETLIRIDLETPITLTTEGTATIAIGDLTADL
jgi:hypothetical protein